jgi:hypothetical protein
MVTSIVSRRERTSKTILAINLTSKELSVYDAFVSKRPNDKKEALSYMKTNFIELQVPGFRAVVPNLKSLPAKEVLALMSITNDSLKQFTYATVLLRSKISEELQDGFDMMDLDETIEFVTQWIAKSNTGSEDTNE